MTTTLQTYTLRPTEEPPVTFTGELIGSYCSSCAVDKAPNRVWFTCDIYRTHGGRWIAFVAYDHGERLGREQPRSIVYDAPTSMELLHALDDVDPVSTFVTGWTDVERAAGKDRLHVTVCGYAASQWESMKANVAAALLSREEARVIE